MRAKALRNAVVAYAAPFGRPLFVYAQYEFQWPFISGIGRTYAGRAQRASDAFSVKRYWSLAPRAIARGLTEPSTSAIIGIDPSRARFWSKFALPQPNIAWPTCVCWPVSC